ncbi:MAG: bifunctional phosphoglucose/phosphomannose isomerase [Nitrososphaerales archaeon]
MKPTKDDVERIDREGLYKDYESWPEQAEQAMKIVVDLKEREVDKIVYCGMGGSGCAGDIIQDLSFNKQDIPPIFVVKGYYLPNFVDSSTLVLAVSYSGETEETLTALEDALKRNCIVVGLSSGGRLEKICVENGIKHVKLGKALTPRTALPSILYSTLIILSKLGYELVSAYELNNAIDTLRRVRSSIGVLNNLEMNEAKQIAYHLHDGYPIIYGTQEYRGVLIRFKNSLNENAKMHALVEVLPEACHNDIEAWYPSALNTRALFILEERDVKLKKRFDTLMELVEKAGSKYHIIYTKEDTLFKKLMSTLYLLEYTTLYLAVLRGIPPAPTPNITLLKNRIRLHQQA